MRDPKRVTLNDVAAASGVSRATASFVLRDSPNQSISAVTRERVRQAARDLGYVPHAIARALPDRETPLRAVRLQFADRTAETLGLSPVAPFSLPVSRTYAADSLAEFRAAHPAVTAAAAFDDDVALRVLAAMRDLGLVAPGDLAVIGFDDNGYGALATPALTTVHIDAEAHGRQAARAILGLDAAGLSADPGRVVVRESA